MRLRFGFLFQMAALFDSLTVFDNVAFGLREHRVCDEARGRGRSSRERLNEVGLPPEIETKKPAELSGGQRKRVGLARALAIDPEVMLYDEPTTGLDPIMSDVINELILQTQRTKKTTGVVVTHDMKTVTKVADRVVMLYPLARLGPDESQILYDGPPEDLESCPDPRVGQFVRGEAGERLREMAMLRTADGLPKTSRAPALRPPATQCEGDHERTSHAVPDRHVRHRGRAGPDHDDRLVRRVAVAAPRPGLSQGAVCRGAGRTRRRPGAQERHPDRRGHGDRLRRAAQPARRRARHAGARAAIPPARGLVPRLTRSLIGDVAIDMEPGNGPGYSRPARSPADAPSSRARSRPTRPRRSRPPPRPSRRPATPWNRSTRPPAGLAKLSDSAEKLDNFLTSVADAGKNVSKAAQGIERVHHGQ